MSQRAKGMQQSLCWPPNYLPSIFSHVHGDASTAPMSPKIPLYMCIYFI